MSLLVFFEWCVPSPYLTAPMLVHRVVNIFPFMLFSFLILMRRDGIYAMLHLSVLDAIVGGMFVWCFGRADTIHVGSSGLICAYYGYILSTSIYGEDSRKALISSAAFVAYLAIFFMFFPMSSSEEKVSWESNAIGVLIGFAFGKLDAEFWVSKGSSGYGDSEETKGLTAEDVEDDSILDDF